MEGPLRRSVASNLNVFLSVKNPSDFRGAFDPSASYKRVGCRPLDNSFSAPWPIASGDRQSALRHHGYFAARESVDVATRAAIYPMGRLAGCTHGIDRFGRNDKSRFVVGAR